MAIFELSVELPVSVEALFDWHLQPEALPLMIPPSEPVQVERAPARLENGARVVLRVGRWPLRLRWVADHRDVQRPHGFVDEQTRGPFARWVHSHRMESLGPQRSRLTDHVDYTLPLEPLSRWVAGWFVRRKLERMFAHRHRVLSEQFA
ncbi:MAG: hypothetical protein DHS20C15_06660 [Planctomycetota bacterium]|nr:MAG: hypothetical protein DHS20C15_06660 [Planctomycetota bacterium]